MPIVKILHKNRGLDGAWTAKGQVATLPSTNLADANRQKLWRSTGAESTQWVRVDLGTCYPIDGFALVSANASTAAVITIETATSSGFGAIVFTTSLTPWNASRSNVLVQFFSATQTYRWWRVNIADTGNTNNYLQLGTVYLSCAVAMDVGPETLGYSIVDPSLVDYAPGGTPKTFSLSPYAVVELPHRLTAESLVFGGLEDVVRNIGRKTDAVLSLFSSAPSCSAIAQATNLYGRFESDPGFSYVVQAGACGLYNTTFRFRESL